MASSPLIESKLYTWQGINARSVIIPHAGHTTIGQVLSARVLVAPCSVLWRDLCPALPSHAKRSCRAVLCCVWQSPTTSGMPCGGLIITSFITSESCLSRALARSIPATDAAGVRAVVLALCFVGSHGPGSSGLFVSRPPAAA